MLRLCSRTGQVYDKVTKYLTWSTHTDVSMTERILKEWVLQYEQDDCYRWAITLKENGSQPIGIIDVVRWDADGETPEVGYCIGSRWRHQRIMTEALDAVLGFLFNQVGVKRVRAEYDTNNPHSGDVMRKCGMTFDGVRERAGKNNQGVCDIGC